MKNLSAFTARYGHPAGVRVIGEWGSDSLSNTGELVKLSFGAGFAIREFTYDDAAPWPADADGSGKSLILSTPGEKPDPTLAGSWTASSESGGSLLMTGGGLTGFAKWLADQGETDPTGDPDGDDIPNTVEYALLLDNSADSRPQLPTIQSMDDGRTGLRFRKNLSATDATFSLRTSHDLIDWTETTDIISETPTGDGTVEVILRAPAGTPSQLYLQLMVRVN